MATPAQSFDVEMPDGTVIQDVPAGTTQQEVLSRYTAMQSQSKQQQLQQNIAKLKAGIANQAPALDRFQQNPMGQPGVGERFAQSFGVPTRVQDQPTPTMGSVLKQNLLNAVTFGAPAAYGALKSALGGMAAGGQNIAQAGANITQGQPVLPAIAQGLQGAAQMQPMSGPLAASMAEDIKNKNYAGAAGTGLGGLTQLGLGALLGGIRAPKFASTESAAAGFKAVDAAAGDMPVNVADTGNTALRIQDLSRSGGTMPKVVRDFLRRVTDPEQGPLTYSEARDFYSNATRLSADEFNRLTPVMKYQVGQFTRSLGNAIQDTATAAGKGTEYAQAMKEYSQAKVNQERIARAKDVATSVIKYGIPGAGAAFAVKHILGGD